MSSTIFGEETPVFSRFNKNQKEITSDIFHGFGDYPNALLIGLCKLAQQLINQCVDGDTTCKFVFDKQSGMLTVTGAAAKSFLDCLDDLLSSTTERTIQGVNEQGLKILVGILEKNCPCKVFYQTGEAYEHSIIIHHPSEEKPWEIMKVILDFHLYNFPLQVVLNTFRKHKSDTSDLHFLRMGRNTLVSFDEEKLSKEEWEDIVYDVQEELKGCSTVKVDIKGSTDVSKMISTAKKVSKDRPIFFHFKDKFLSLTGTDEERKFFKDEFSKAIQE